MVIKQRVSNQRGYFVNEILHLCISMLYVKRLSQLIRLKVNGEVWKPIKLAFIGLNISH